MINLALCPNVQILNTQTVIHPSPIKNNPHNHILNIKWPALKFESPPPPRSSKTRAFLIRSRRARAINEISSRRAS